MDKKYSPRELEKKIYEKWMKNNCFLPKESKSNYSIVLPPPNVTGTLHMGHAFQHTIIDILIRYNRMLGKSVLWQPGTDHAGIATQIVVENNLKQQGKSREKMKRNDLVKEIWKWKEKSGNTIINQTKRIGSSADWSRNRFTMDEGLSDSVKKVFIELYEQNIQSIMIEGGAITLQSFINANTWDEARIFTTKKELINGVKAPEITGALRDNTKIGDDHLKILHNA